MLTFMCYRISDCVDLVGIRVVDPGNCSRRVVLRVGVY